MFIDPFVLTLSDSRGNQVSSHRFTDSRTFYLWEEVNVRARFVRIDSLEYPGMKDSGARPGGVSAGPMLFLL